MQKTLLLIALWTATTTFVQSAPPTHQSEVPMQVEFSQAGDTSVITSSGSSNSDRTILDLRSERGIGTCRIHRKLDKWPERLILRLHLRGLEQIAVHIGDRKWIGAVSSSDGIVRWTSTSDDAMEQTIDSSDPNWCSIRVLRGNESPATENEPPIPMPPSTTDSNSPQKIRVPLEEDESWEMTFPPAWLQENPSSIRISWIDFFR